MLVDTLLPNALRVAVLLALALGMMPLLRRASSATRRLVLALAFGGALILPVAASLAPAWHVEAPVALASLRPVMIAEPLVIGEVAPRVSAGTELPSRPAPAVDVATLVVALWAVGVLLLVLRLTLGLAKSRSMLSRTGAAPAWSRASERVKSDITVRMTNELDAPAITGVVTPVILVPLDSESWSEQRRDAVLAHELAHVRQRDCLVQIVAQLACAFHWFNPLAWLAFRRLKIERELAADDAVIAAGARPSSYAEDLLAIAGAVRVPTGALGMAEPSQLALRVTAIVSTMRSRRPMGRVGVVLLAAGCASITLLLACARPTAGNTGRAASVSARVEPALSAMDPKLQAIANDELDRAMSEWQARAGTVLVLDPNTGEILANAGRSQGAVYDVATNGSYIVGSTFKPFTMAAALEEGVISPTDSFDCEHGAWTYDGLVLHDAGSYGALTVTQILAVSSNIGTSKVFDRLGWERLRPWLHAFHFEAVPEHVPGRYAGAVIAIGESLAQSPLQVAAAYATLASGGSYVAPTATRRTSHVSREQVMKPETAREITLMLEEVVNGELGTGRLARVGGLRVAGKTGTAAWEVPGGEGRYASFVGFVPSVAPRLVILVGVEQPRDGESGGIVAAPVFARVASRALGI